MIATLEDEMLSHVYWIGGGSGAGKSTIARRLAAQHNLHYYSTDDAMADHARRTTPDDSPFLHAFIAMDHDERWATRDPQTMLDTFHWYRGEGFDLILEDLQEISGPVIAEGFRLLPHLVRKVATPGQAVWLLPDPDFRRAAFETRGGLWTIAGRTSDPERALRNLLDRDGMFTDRLRAETRDLPAIEVTRTMTEDELTTLVAEALGLSAMAHEFTDGLYGSITHTELISTDPAATRDWCVGVLGWNFPPPMPTPAGDYHLFAYSEQGGGGIRATGPGEAPGSTPTVHVRDTQAAYDAALAAGAEPVNPPTKIMDGVFIALVRAPGGVLIGFSGPTDTPPSG